MGFKDRVKNAFGLGKREEPTGKVHMEGGDSHKTELSSGDVLFVCGSNTVISPIAEAIFNRFSDERKAYSAGLYAVAGAGASNDAIAVCERHGFDLSEHVARSVTDFSLDDAVLVLASHVQVKDALKMKFPHLEIYTIREYAGDSSLDISDPIGGGPEGFERCFMEIHQAILKITGHEEEIVDRPAAIVEETPDESASPFEGADGEEDDSGPEENQDEDEIVDRLNRIENFRYLDGLIHSGAKEIVLDADIVLEDGEKSEYEDGITVDVDDLVIDGRGHTIDANEEAKIFSCSGKNITIKNVTIKNGYSGYEGGAIDNLGSLTVIKSIFIDNYSDLFGGAICNERDSVLSILQSTFTGNCAYVGGGAVCNLAADLTIIDSTFSDNSVENGTGGVIFDVGRSHIHDCEISHNSSPDIILSTNFSQIYNTVFRDNTAEDLIFNRKGNSNLGIFYCKFIKNDVENSVVYNDGRYCGIDKSTFADNLSNAGARNIINNTEMALINPAIKDKGKSIFNKGYIIIKKSLQDIEGMIEGKGVVEVDEVIIPHGKSYDFGYLDKKIHESDSKEIVLEHDIDFKNYERDYYEGGIELDIDGLTIDGNGKTIDGAGKSRIFIVTGNNIRLKNIIFKNGHFHESLEYPMDIGGGALKINHDSNLVIENCEFIDNVSNYWGGAIDNSGDAAIIESKFIDNMAYDDGGVIYNRGVMDIMKSDFTGSVSKKRGGGAYNSERLTIDESSFIHNRAVINGGSVYNDGELDISKSELKDNIAHRYGGGAYNGGKLTISGSAVENNSSRGSGAGAYNEGELIVASSTVNGNDSGYDGGGIYNSGSLTVSESAVDNNSAKYDGGALSNVGEVNIRGSEFIENTSKGFGGALNNSGELDIKDAEFLENASEEFGGAIYNVGELGIADVEFAKNKSQKYGGAVYTRDNDLTISGSAFNDNVADEVGGAIFNATGQLIILKSVFTGNNAHISGGGIFNNEAILSITESSFKDNSSDESAGAIFNQDGDANITDCALDDNMARIGGGAIINTAKLTISKSSLTHNRTMGIGGAIISTDILVMSDSKVLDNSAVHMAGAIDNYGGEATISESVFTGNEVKWDGGEAIPESIFDRDDWNASGIIYNDGGKLRVLDSSFADNIIRWGESGVILSNNSDYEVAGCSFENDHPDVAECMDESDIEWEADDVSSIPDDDEDIDLDPDVISDDGEEEESSDDVTEDDVVSDSTPDEDDSDWRPEDYQPDDIAIGFGFKDLDELIHSGRDEIVLDTDVCLKRDNQSEYLNGIRLDVDGLVIDGDGHTIDACGKVRIFECCAKNVTIRNIRLRNGFAEYGGAVCNDGGDLTIVSSDLLNSSARNGGAIRNLQGTLNVLESVMSNNTASSSGGAISNSDILNIEKSIISENTAGSGGGIGNGGKLTIKDSILKQNKAESHYGGAIDNAEELTIIDSELTGNFAERDGGAIHNNCADLLLIGSAFSGNRANEKGDAIFNYRENSFKAENCDLEFWDVTKYNEYDGGD